MEAQGYTEVATRAAAPFNGDTIAQRTTLVHRGRGTFIELLTGKTEYAVDVVLAASTSLHI